jgi:hypothetical protein
LGDSGRQHLEPNPIGDGHPVAFAFTVGTANADSDTDAYRGTDAYRQTTGLDHQRAMHGHNRRRPADRNVYRDVPALTASWVE